MQRSAEEFKAQATALDRDHWTIRDCGLCGYPLSYIFHDDGSVSFDSGCNCCGGGPTLSPRTWDEIAEHYNRNQPERNPEITREWLDKADEFWQFSAQTQAVAEADERAAACRADYRNCSRCKTPVLPDDPRTLVRIQGWERRSSAASRRGGSDILLRERLDEYLCSGCAHALKAGVAPLQGELVPRAA